MSTQLLADFVLERSAHNAWATIIGAVKVSLYNEEQLRLWHDRTGRGPADHPLLQPDPPYFGFVDLTKEQAKAIDREQLALLEDATSASAA